MSLGPAYGTDLAPQSPMHKDLGPLSSPQRGVGDVLEDVLKNVGHMIRAELRLVVAEFREEGKKAGRAMAFVALGMVLLASTLALLLTAAVMALSTTLEPWAAALVVALACVIIGGILVRAGFTQLSRVDPIPDRPVARLREDAAWLKAHAK